ncbi:MAG: sugar kinase [Elusimicrobia bacterium RIFCSPLOWO2_01_FULL_54_10]|nr:MAG: sugar kinase [Elusimicrobia bacterium RIFCSPLOWO2_01_FULL_54_10]
MSLLVVGSVAFDSVKTPFGQAKEVLGGSATYFSVAASFFTKVSLVAVVGEDFPEKDIQFLKSRKIDTAGLERAKGETFRWKGEYGFQLNEAKTLDTRLNVFQNFWPKLPEAYKKLDIVFLGNIDPDLQREVLQQVTKPKLVALDTMNFWISGKKDSLIKTLGLVDILIINDGEARQLSGEHNLVQAAQKIQSMGPKILIIKRGEYGALLFSRKSVFHAPAYPLEKVFDPTGAGDSFAGGFMGYLAKTRKFDDANFRKAIIMGSVLASFNVEDFSLNRFKRLKNSEITARFKAFKNLTHFENL